MNDKIVFYLLCNNYYKNILFLIKIICIIFLSITLIIFIININGLKNIILPQIIGNIIKIKNTTINEDNINFVNKNFEINYINLALNIDDTYIYPCLVFLTSLLNNRANSTFYIIHIMTTQNIKNDTIFKINTILKTFGNSSLNVTFYNMGEQFKNKKHSAAYYRVSLPSLLPNLDKIIYIDTDVINFKDLSEMNKIELDDEIYFCGALDFIRHVDELKKFNIYTDKIINSGILIMNLKALRNNNIEQKLKQFISSYFSIYYEQTAINAICHNNFKILPYKFARFPFDSYEDLINFNNEQYNLYRFNKSELIKAFNEPTLIHFAGTNKPWNIKYSKFIRAYWWYYAKKSGFYEEILDYYKFKKENIEKILGKIPKNDIFRKRI